MATVFIPAQWRDLTGGLTQAQVEGNSLGRIITALETQFPGISARLCDQGTIASGLAVSIDGSVTTRGLLAPVLPESEIHFLPAIGGG